VSSRLIVDFSTLFSHLLNSLGVAVKVSSSNIESGNFVIGVEFFKDLVISFSGCKFMNKFLINGVISSVFIKLVQQIVYLNFSGIQLNS
jgi:hypothetical protein